MFFPTRKNIIIHTKKHPDPEFALKPSDFYAIGSDGGGNVLRAGCSIGKLTVSCVCHMLSNNMKVYLKGALKVDVCIKKLVILWMFAF